MQLQMNHPSFDRATPSSLLRCRITVLLVSRSDCMASIVPWSSTIFSSLFAMSERDMSRPLITPCVKRLCLLHNSLISSLTFGGSATWAFLSVLRISVAKEESAVAVGAMSLKRTGVGVPSDPDVEKSLLPPVAVAGVVNTSSPVTVGVGVGQIAWPLFAISSKLRLPGVEKLSVLIALRGVSGGGIVIWLCEDAWSAAFDSSSSSLAGQS